MDLYSTVKIVKYPEPEGTRYVGILARITHIPDDVRTYYEVDFVLNNEVNTLLIYANEMVLATLDDYTFIQWLEYGII